MSPFVTRWGCLWQVPDVALIFDEDEFIRSVEPDVSDEQNAFVNYAAAAKLLTRTGSRWSANGSDAAQIPQLIDAATQDMNAEWDERLTRWLSDNEETLAEYRHGGDKASARDLSLRTADFYSILTVHNDVRHLAHLTLLEAIRCERTGDLEEAWLWHRANLRGARHAEYPPWAICRAVSATVRYRALQGLTHWAESATLTAERLRQARKELAKEVADRTPLSTITKAEYLLSRNSLRRPDAPNVLIPPSVGLATRNPAWLSLQRTGLWVFGMPEVSLRSQRQVMVNQRDQIDLPLPLRRKAVRTTVELVFEETSAGKRVWGQLGPAQLSRLLDSPAVKSLRSSPNGSLGLNSVWCDETIRMDNARVSAVAVVLAAQEFHRTHGEFPAALEELVPDFLDEVPLDPMDATGASLRYRRDVDGHAVVWSIGRDGKDDGGDFGNPKVIDKDAGYQIRRPQPLPNASKKVTPPTNEPDSATPNNKQ